jgi:glutathione gamma-glutamylcysteinyltransferase
LRPATPRFKLLIMLGTPLTSPDANCVDHVLTHFQPQEHPLFCGLATVCCLANACRVAGKTQPLTQARLLELLAPTPKDRERILRSGIGLDEAARALSRLGCQAERHHATDPCSNRFIEDLRTLHQAPMTCLAVGYHRAELGQHGSGHLSPVGGYREADRHVLILDTATMRYPPIWIHADDLYAAMATTVESPDDQPRGWITCHPPTRR